MCQNNGRDVADGQIEFFVLNCRTAVVADWLGAIFDPVALQRDTVMNIAMDLQRVRGVGQSDHVIKRQQQGLIRSVDQVDFLDPDKLVICHSGQIQCGRSRRNLQGVQTCAKIHGVRGSESHRVIARSGNDGVIASARIDVVGSFIANDAVAA